MKLIGVVIMIFAFVGCASLKPQTFKRDYSPVNAKEFKYEDKNISFTYVPTSFDPSVPVHFVNKTDKPIKIIWDEVTFINPTGEAEKVIHEGVRLLDRNASMSPSLIPPKGNTKDAITPTSRVTWGSLYFGGPQDWQYQAICGNRKWDIVTHEIEQLDEECVGKVFGLFVTYEVDGKKYTFSARYKFDKRGSSK